MISMIDMTTGEWEIDSTAPDARLAADEPAPHLDAYQANLPLIAGLCEHETTRLLHAGMPLMLATLDVDEFISRMTATVH